MLHTSSPLEKAILFPSGNHDGYDSAPLESVVLDSIFPSRSSTHISPFESSLREVKANLFPSLLHAGAESDAVWNVICRAGPPFMGTSQISLFPLLLDTKATIFPSGETAG